MAAGLKNFGLPTIAFILIINALPLIGVLLWGWSLSSLLFLYWLESLIVGLMNIVRLSVSNGPPRERIGKTLFFLIHYGGFWLAHGFFLFVMLMPEIAKYRGAAEEEQFYQSLQSVKYIFWGLMLSYGVSTAADILRTTRAERLTPIMQMFAPYGRVFVMHIVILGGAYLAAQYASVTGVVLLFVGLKVTFDVGVHVLIRHKQSKA